jgi:uncharacterized protein (DUF924 family)
LAVFTAAERRRAEEILQFWFGSVDPADASVGFEMRWFQKDPAFDREIHSRFHEDVDEACRGLRDHWCRTPVGLLATCILLDQFTRNLFRGSPRSWGTDPHTRALVKRALSEGLDRQIAPTQRTFVYLPLEHSEDVADHDRALLLFEAMLAEAGPAQAPMVGMLLKYEHAHRDLIVRFGRYPHRNKVLGRKNTPEEDAYLAQPGAGF